MTAQREVEWEQPREFAPELALRRAIAMLSAAGPEASWAWLGRDAHRLGAAGVCRVPPGRVLHVVGSTALAGRMRELLHDGAEPGWRLHPVPAGDTPLEHVIEPLARRTGTNRFYNLLDRAGFSTVEELAATPEPALLAIRNVGHQLVSTLREALRDLALDGTDGPSTEPRDADGPADAPYGGPAEAPCGGGAEPPGPAVAHLLALLDLLPSSANREFWTRLAEARDQETTPAINKPQQPPDRAPRPTDRTTQPTDEATRPVDETTRPTDPTALRTGGAAWLAEGVCGGVAAVRAEPANTAALRELARACLLAFDGADLARWTLLDPVVGYPAPDLAAGRRWTADVTATAWRIFVPLEAEHRRATR